MPVFSIALSFDRQSFHSGIIKNVSLKSLVKSLVRINFAYKRPSEALKLKLKLDSTTKPSQERLLQEIMIRARYQSIFKSKVTPPLLFYSLKTEDLL